MADKTAYIGGFVVEEEKNKVMYCCKGAAELTIPNVGEGHEAKLMVPATELKKESCKQSKEECNGNDSNINFELECEGFSDEEKKIGFCCYVHDGNINLRLKGDPVKEGGDAAPAADAAADTAAPAADTAAPAADTAAPAADAPAADAAAT